MEKKWLVHYDEGVPKTIDYPEFTLHGLLEHSAKEYPDRISVIFPGRLGDSCKLKFKDVDALSNRFANALIKMGVKKGDRVALLLPNCPQFVISYYGILKAGGIVVACNPLYSGRELEHQLKDCGAETIVVLSLFYPTLQSIRSQTQIKNVVVTRIKEYLPPITRFLFALAKEKKEGHYLRKSDAPEASFFQDFLKGADAKRPSVQVSPDDVAGLQYTGGTTGTSKGAILSHRNIMVNAHHMKAWSAPLQFTADEEGAVMGVMPLFHVYGMVTVLHYSMLMGMTMVLQPRFETDQVLKAINRYKPKFFPGVPTMYVAMINHPKLNKYNLRSIRACISGAAPLPLEVQQRFEEITGGKLVEGFGLSEAPTATHCSPLAGIRKMGSIGIPFPDVEAKIMDMETGEKEMPVGEIGELVLKSPQVMLGYWNRPEETAKVLRNGWLYTGDLAKVDEDGYFSIVDRKKEMIIAGGYNIYPREVEEVLYENDKIKEACCYGIPDPYRGETVKVCIVLKDGQKASPEEITEFCRTRLAKYKIPKVIEFRDSLPKSPIGKVLRRVLVEEEKDRTKKSGAAAV